MMRAGSGAVLHFRHLSPARPRELSFHFEGFHMSQRSDVRIASLQPAPAATRGFFLRVCTNNPFYVLSAVLFLFGLRISYGEQVAAVQTWSLFGSLTAYTLLLAATAALLVRFGNVWDDVRTDLLLVVLMFLAASVIFDEVLFLDSVRAFTCCIGGLVLSVAVSEGLLHGIRLRLPALFRVPYYLALALFFLYPLALSGLVNSHRGEALQWGLYGFSVAAGLVAVTLLPAVRRGPSYSAANGSPWSWPFYPWVLFGMLGVAVPARAFLLCWSVHGIVSDERTRTIFQPYFLAPFGLAVAVLLLELGIVSSRKGVLRSALLVPVVVVCLAIVGYDAYPIQGFRAIFAERLGADPLKLTLLASACFYGYAALRRVQFAADALSAALVALAFVGAKAANPYVPGTPEGGLLMAAAALQLALGLWRRDGVRCLLGTAGLAVGVALALPAANPGAPLRWVVALHLEVAGLLALGAAFRGRFGQSLRAAAATLVLLACLAATFLPINIDPGIPHRAVLAYPPVAATFLAGYCLLLRDRGSLAAAALAWVGWLAEAGRYGYGALHQAVPGLNHIALSLVLFAVAVAVSLAKAGLLSRWFEAWSAALPDMAGMRGEVKNPVHSPDPGEADDFGVDP
jgi:hypothetical protein